MDDLTRSRLQQAQQQAKQPTQPLVYRIGDRDPATGKYELIYPDGSKATGAEKLYSAASQPGDRVLAQQRTDGTWLLSEAGASRRRKAAAPSAMPPRVRKRSQVWIFYELEGGLWVGGHQAVPVRIGDRPADFKGGYIWGDSQGWYVSIVRNGSITSIDSTGGFTTLDNPTGTYFPIGAGYWEFINKDFSYTPVNPGGTNAADLFRVTIVDDRGGYDIFKSYSFTAEVGLWSARGGHESGQYNYSIADSTPSAAGSDSTSALRHPSNHNWSMNATTSLQLNSLGISFSATVSSIDHSRYAQLVSDPPAINLYTTTGNSDRIWLCDRYSLLSLGIGSFVSGSLATLSKRQNNITTQIGPPREDFYGALGANIFPKAFGTPDPGALWNGAPGMNSFRWAVLPAGTIYTNGRVTSITLTEAEKLKLSTQTIDVSEVAIDGATSPFPVLGFAIPPTANILSFCGSLL